ncbi:MAG TPA: hypothetical protein VJH68_04845 [Candidatus Nanoarchaeia archaeon]|nr:hypothetical protein [Candidatus Nanoarchaeia archaeon]
MKIKRMVRRLFAVGTGVAMLGATAMGAMAADLSDYPTMFVDNGRFNGFLVVGDSAQPVDNLAMTDIAARMMVAGSKGSTSTAVTGDAWLVGTSSKKLELANSNTTSSSIAGETFRDINTFIGEEDLGALADGTWSTNENDYGFQQFLFFDGEGEAGLPTNRVVKYSENDDDVTDLHAFFKSGKQIGRFKLEFSSNAQSDVTDSTGTSTTTGTYLDDFENTDLSFMGRDYSVVLARRTSSGGDENQNGIKLTLMAGATRDTLLEGESRTYAVGTKSYDVELSFTDSDEAKFIVNGEATNKLKVGETYVLGDKSEIGVSEILYQAYSGGVHSATFFVGAQKIVLQDDDITAVNTGDKKLRVGAEDIDGTNVFFTGTDNNVTFSVSTIEVNMTSDDDYFLGAGQKLSDVIAASGEEKEVLMFGGLDVEFTGLAAETTRELKLSSSSARKYELNLYDGDGNLVAIPTAYAESTTNISIGGDSVAGGNGNRKRLHLNESQTTATAQPDWGLRNTEIFKNDYFVLTGGTASDGSAKSYLLQYRGADKSGDTAPKIKFKNVGSGETLEYAATTSGTTVVDVATIKLGGYSFLVQNASTQASDDYTVFVDMDGGGAITANSAAFITFVDYYGSQWAWATNSTIAGPTAVNLMVNGSVGLSTFNITQTTPNADDYDNIAPSNVALQVSLAAGPEVRVAQTGLTLITPDGETEIAYGYTSTGTKVTLKSPSGDPQELVLEYPEKQRLPQVYFTSGATTKAVSSAGGNLVSVEVVDATKLASEISSVEAQNLIVVGGPCVNRVAAELLGNPADCSTGFTPGEARVKLFEHSNGNMAMLVAGYSGADTRLAGKVVANRPGDLVGSEVVISGPTASSATVRRVGAQ